MDFARNERGFCVGFAWNLILFSFMREREGYKHHADCTVSTTSKQTFISLFGIIGIYTFDHCLSKNISDSVVNVIIFSLK